MKLSRWFAVLIAFSSKTIITTEATCTAEDTPCLENSGACSAAVLLALPPNNDISAATDALRYGKYCGGLNKCVPAEENTKEDDNICVIDEGRDPCPAVPCDGPDTACEAHDSCLDAIIEVNPPPAGERIPVPDRCPCDVAFTAALAAQAATGRPTGLCDEIFYTVPQANGLTLIETFQHEAVLLAAAYCCDVLLCEQDAQDNGYADIYPVAAGFCTGVLQGIQSGLGVDLCAAPDTEPPTPAPTTPEPVGTCTLCSNGEQYNIIAITDFGVPCAVLAASATQLPPHPNVDCIALQTIGWQQCDCPNPPDVIPGDQCHICGDESATFNADKVIVETGRDPALFGNTTTCGEFNAVASFVPDVDNSCLPFAELGAFCECDNQPPPGCTICGDGMFVPDPDISLGDYIDLPDIIDDPDVDPDRLTCGALDLAASFVGPGDSEQCEQLQSFAFACQCPNVEPLCSLCPLGESPPNQDELIPGTNTNCAQLELVATAFGDEFDCISVQEIGVLVCGCEPGDEPGPCGTSICPDGSDIPNPDTELIINGIAPVTCQEFENALNVFNDPVDCEYVNFIGVQFCGCPGDPIGCPLCGDGGIPNPLGFFDDDACTELAFTAFALEAGSAECIVLQGVAGVYCGCNPLTGVDVCRICGEGNLLPDPSREIDVPGPFDFGTCGQAELAGNAQGAVCDQLQSQFSGQCCSEPTTSPTTVPPTPPPSTADPRPDPPTMPPTTLPPPTLPPTGPPTDPPTDPPSGGVPVAKTPVAVAVVMVSVALLQYL